MSITFPFRTETSSLLGIIKRPIAKVAFYNKKLRSWKVVEMIIDTGADYTLIPKYLAQVIGIDIGKETIPIKTQGVGGQETVFLLKNRIKVRIGNYERSIMLGVINNNHIPPLLGRHTFFETFKVIFEKYTTTFS